jgi:hypothetical protein
VSDVAIIVTGPGDHVAAALDDVEVTAASEDAPLTIRAGLWQAARAPLTQPY